MPSGLSSCHIEVESVEENITCKCRKEDQDSQEIKVLEYWHIVATAADLLRPLADFGGGGLVVTVVVFATAVHFTATVLVVAAAVRQRVDLHPSQPPLLSRPFDGVVLGSDPFNVLAKLLHFFLQLPQHVYINLLKPNLDNFHK